MKVDRLSFPMQADARAYEAHVGRIVKCLKKFNKTLKKRHKGR